MKYKILIAIILVLSIVLIGLMTYIIITPTKVPVVPVPPTPTYPENELAGIIGVKRPIKEIPRMFAINFYGHKPGTMLPAKVINNIENLSYFMLDEAANTNLLIMPFETGGTLRICKVVWDDYKEKYVADETQVVYERLVEPKFALLLKCDFAFDQRYEIKLIQGEDTATYWLEPPAEGEQIPETCFVKLDTKTEDGYTESQEPDIIMENIDETLNEEMAEPNPDEVTQTNESTEPNE